MSDDTPLSPEVAALRRTGFIPVTTPEEGALTDSKLGGRPWLAGDEDWPRCPNCKNPLQHFLQLNVSQLPSQEQERLGSTGLIQLFYCTNSEPLCEVECDAYLPFARSVVARFVSDFDGPTNDEAAGPEEPFGAKRITDWEPVEDYPNYEELSYEMGIDLEPEDEDYLDAIEAPAAGDKLGGWPAWIQGEEYPSCPQCSTSMDLVFQIDSNVNLPFMFGDSGTGHLTRCPNHPEVLAFAWACC